MPDKPDKPAEAAKTSQGPGCRMKPWYEEHPHWLTTELEALDAAGIRYQRDEEAFGRGTARLQVDVAIDGFGPVKLTVTFPELYPYFRFEVQAESLDLRHHQNPFDKNLCLLPRGTEEWSPTDTVASVLSTQLPKLFKTARAERREEVVGLEVPQAEPVSAYYETNAFSIVIVQSDWHIPPDVASGRFILGTQGLGTELTLPVRGAVLKVLDGERKTLAEADPAIARGFGGTSIEGLWIRVPSAILKQNPADFLQAVLDHGRALREGPYGRVRGGFVKVWGVLFPEEVSHRITGEGWMFVSHFDQKLDRLGRKLEALRRPPTGSR